MPTVVIVVKAQYKEAMYLAKEVKRATEKILIDTKCKVI
jgi:hypothetical protein